MKYYYNEPVCQVYYVEDKNYIHTNWEGYCPSDKFRAACNAMLTALRETKSGKVLIDATRTKSASPEDQKWLMEEWTPLAVEAGYRKFVYILPADVFGQFSSKNVLKQTTARGDIESVTVNTLEDALEWLLKDEDKVLV
jgi:hypothetical protein